MQALSKVANILKVGSGPLALVICLYLVFSLQNKSSKIGYVRSNDLIYGYAGMKEAESELTERAMKKQALVDTLSLDLKADIKQYSLIEADLSTETKQRKADTLRQRQIQLKTYSNSVSEFVKEEETKMLTGIFNQINSFVKTFAEENGFAMIYGTTSEGNILYGEPALDVTDELLMNLNQQYNGKAL